MPITAPHPATDSVASQNALPTVASPTLLKQLNISPWEYEQIVSQLGRHPNFNELSMFSVLWSEHCCYKHSKHLLKTLPTTGPRILQGPGENAGVVAIDDAIAIAFKIESHNHPTAVEPFQGATTGVGGILRDIFTMNARPVANLNALRFGPLDDPNNHRLFTQAVAGIAHYGNCVGVPTVAGDVFFDPCYTANPLVNAMSLGMLYRGQMMASGAQGIGNPVIYAGSATGKDGMGGAAFASKELDESSADDRPAVQVGDPFAEKLLIESCLEVFATGAIVAAQDMGAAGLTCSAAEMSAKGGVGMLIDLDKVPAREPGMQAFEYLLSESQERMLFVVEKGREPEVLAIFEKWGVPASTVGEVTPATGEAGGHVVFTHHGQVVVDVPAHALTDGAPLYARDDIPEKPAELAARNATDVTADSPDLALSDVGDWLAKLLKSHNIARPVGVFQQYDRHVRNSTLLASECNSAGVIQLRREDETLSDWGIAMTVDCNPRYVALNPFEGAKATVAEAARNLVAVGATPLAVTDNLNFGNPEKDAIYYQLAWATKGLGAACEALNTPITGGNVSLYNEHGGTAIHPTPVVGMVGLLDDAQRAMTPQFKAAGQGIALVGRFAPTVDASEYQAQRWQTLAGEPPTVDLAQEVATNAWVLSQITAQTVTAVQDVSMGGLLTTLTEMAFPIEQDATTVPSIGFSVDMTPLMPLAKRLDTACFGETAGCFVVTYDHNQADTLAQSAQAAGAPWQVLGTTTADPTLQLTVQTTTETWPLAPLGQAWNTALRLEPQATTSLGEPS